MATKIKDVFDQTKSIYRNIEKVITYGDAQEARLKNEITEYIATESIEESFQKLITDMQIALDSNGGNEIGVWVSGFYGSGKSSFTKYLGLALDDSKKIGETRFLQYLQDRINSTQIRAQLGTLAKNHPAAVVMLDLASEMLAGATMEDVSTVLYYKVLQWAGYSRNLKVAAFERKLKKDGRYDEFLKLIQESAGVPWSQVQNDTLVIDSLIPAIAHEMYPQFFKTDSAFNTEDSTIKIFENERVKEMLDIVREKTGRDFVIFIIDEVGQYVGSRKNLILNLDGLAKNLKAIGNGKAWIIGTAQQTLTEDDPRAALNSPELFKLKDRFPIQIDLESSDIREICYRRLLGKSSDGTKLLEQLFDEKGQALRFNTKLQDAKSFDSDFDKKTFVNLYPFLPAHFDILLHLLGALAKSTGGIGLRSAIKVIQDILIEGVEHQEPVADKEVGWLATTVTLFDVLEKDINRAFGSLYKAIGKVKTRMGDPIHMNIAKTVVILQILDAMPITAQNICSLMHPDVDAVSQKKEVEQAIREMIADPYIPFGEKDGKLCFFSERLNDIDQERAQIPLRMMDLRRIQNESLKDAFSPLPSTRLGGSFIVTAGLKIQAGLVISALEGERNAVQIIIKFVEPAEYEDERTALVDESRQRSLQNTIYLLGRINTETDEKTGDIYRCQEIAQKYRNDVDPEIKEYCTSQADRARKLTTDLVHSLQKDLASGSFIFRGQTTAVESIDLDIQEAAKKYLADVANQVFDRYAEAPVRAGTDLAEKFLKVSNLKSVTSEIDPLNLVQIIGGTPHINADHKALVSIRDFIDQQGNVEGRRLMDHFGDAPFGWSNDTLRYIVAAMLVDGEITLKVSGREIKVKGQSAIDALRNNNTFKAVGVALRDERLSTEVLARAAERLTELTGEMVVPLEDEISKIATKFFPKCQQQFGSLPETLNHLELSGANEMQTLNQTMADILVTDASDAPKLLGAENSALYQQLKWAFDVNKSLKDGLENTIREFQKHRRLIENLPSVGTPAKLKNELSGEFAQFSEKLSAADFYAHTADLNSSLTQVQESVKGAVTTMIDEHRKKVKNAATSLAAMREWTELNQAQRSDIMGKLDDLEEVESATDLSGIQILQNASYETNAKIDEFRAQIVQIAKVKEQERIAAAREEAKKVGKKTYKKEIKFPARIKTASDLDKLIAQLQMLKSESASYADIELDIRIGE